VRHLLLRVADAALLLWIVTTLTFALLHLAPGDPATLLIAPTATAAEVSLLRAQLGLDAPLPLQYARWLSGVLQGDLGQSLARAMPVRTVIAEALPVSVFLGGVSLGLSFVLGTALGVVQALRAGRRADRLLSLVSVTLYAAPGFWLALALVALFTSGAAVLGLPGWIRLPAFGMQSPGAGDAVTLERPGTPRRVAPARVIDPRSGRRGPLRPAIHP